MSQPQHYHQPQYPMRHHQSSYQLPQQHQQQPPYASHMPPPGYPSQGPPQGPAQGPPSTAYQPYTVPSMPQQQQQDPQRYFSPGPSSEQPAQQGFNAQYPHQQAPPNGQAPFHFIPGGVHDQPQPPQSSAIGRKPTPQQAAADPYANTPSAPPGPPSGGFQGQIRPGSIHTLNSGNPQELGTGGYESPIDNRHSIAVPSGVGGYDPYVAPPQQQPQQRPDLGPQMQRMSLESPTSVYSTQQPPMPEHNAPPPLQQQAPAPPQGGYQAYQAYQPPQQQQQLPPQAQGAAGGDPGDFYR
jgi:signal transducing adaptor molecule